MNQDNNKKITKILKFLTNLSKNNNREWFQSNKNSYQIVKKYFQDIVNEIFRGISSFDETLNDPKLCLYFFRINRDIRFSKNKTPYKTHFSAIISPTINDKNGVFYYFQIGINDKDRIMGGGIWESNPEKLYKIRKYISQKFDEIDKILNKKNIRNNFELETNNKLKRAPRGFKENDKAIELIKLKHFTLNKKLDFDFMNSDNFIYDVIKLYSSIYPFIDFFRKV